MCNKKWNKHYLKICNSTTYLSFRNALINFLKSSGNKIFNIPEHVRIKLLKRLWLGFSHLHKHKFKHNFEETLNQLCSCSIYPETTMIFFLRCQFYIVIRANLMSDSLNKANSFLTGNGEKLLDILLSSNSKFNIKTYQNILICTFRLIINSHRFDKSIF